MKVLDLCCSHGHGFEGWFASEDDFLRQQADAQIACPMCGDVSIRRLPSAPRLNLSSARQTAVPVSQGRSRSEGAATVGSASSAAAAGPRQEATPESVAAVVTGLEQAWMNAVRQVISQTEDVGPRFAEEARRMHYGEVEARGIRGQASLEEARSLLDEGIEVSVLPVPDALKGPSH